MPPYSFDSASGDSLAGPSRVAGRDDGLAHHIYRDPREVRHAGLLDLLGHKGEPWMAHLRDYLKHAGSVDYEGLEWRFHAAVDGKRPVSNICTWEFGGRAILGHVYTILEYRQRGIARFLLDAVVAEFRARGGRTIQLNAEPRSFQEEFYRSHGFRPVAGVPGALIQENTPTPAPIRCPGGARAVRPFAWRDWPGLNALLLRADLPAVRWAAADLYGPGSAEYPLLRLLFGNPAIDREAIRVVAHGTEVAGLISLIPLRDGSGGQIFDICLDPSLHETAGSLAQPLLQAVQGPVEWRIAPRDVDYWAPWEFGFAHSERAARLDGGMPTDVWRRES